MKKYTLIFLLFLCQLNFVFGQNVSVSIPAYNIIYIGLENEIKIVVEGHKNSEIIKQVNGAEIIEKEGKMFLKAKQRGFANLYIGVKQNLSTKWLDTIVFRVRDFTDEIEPQMGTIQDGSIEKSSVIYANTARVFIALGSDFIIEGVRAVVTKYSIQLQDSFGIEIIDVDGSNIPDKIRNRARSMSQGGTISIYNIYYKVYRGKDTLFKEQRLRKDLKITVESDGIPQYIISTNYLNKDNKIKHGKWVYSGGFQNNWVYLEEQYDSGVLVHYTHYDMTGFKTVDFNIPKYADSIFYQEFYANNKIKREGWIVVNHDDYQFVSEVIDESICGYTDTIFPKNNLMDFYSKLKFIPIGKWKEYNEDGKLISNAGFIKIFKYRNKQSVNVHYTNSFTIMPNGNWNEYHNNGNILNKYFYENGYRK